ncbi:ATPase, T2SS/T4P/T4SS family [Massilia antarctica]|uniref:ATPase, T2SS/T4P/T4SS family n=1 Tax=Massilia antarctica TaxID=2765360 RepID=UPI0006BB7A12|nr:ATPase, T2SS/T4P/T4SS family [Massilia sp. H27-R4]MCY0911267.1 ATPase, T2SS/T4P/T4SS family [Massilia sp. H27-R4]CUI05138.1 Type II secretory pathway, ATPase PulE/Tfp pilus assembly pathway, ATPase PilB [Janthinobacterium sp. CG23_2]CUU28924.1 Type II secretory pathway, ATPase PulE/Tfp pilus assembly pathway, ATPase PilB [Janthinobacterium sp. CG23_2]
MSYGHLFTGAAAPDSAAAEVRAYRILLVDDEPNVLSALRRVFRQENYEIVTSGNPRDALALLKAETFHLIISDFMMPGMDGGELLRQARQIEPDMIRIMLTGHADVNAVVGAVKTGAVYKFILKPWNDDDLRVTVALALERQELNRSNKALIQDNARKSHEIEQMAKFSAGNRSRLATVLHRHGKLTLGQVQELIRIQQQAQKQQAVLKEIVERGWVQEKVVHDLLAAELMIQQVNVDEMAVDVAVAALVPAALCQRHLIIPLRIDDKRLTVAMADPLDEGLLHDLRFVTGLEIAPVLASMSAIVAKIASVYNTGQADLTDLEAAFGSNDPYEGVEIVIEDDGTGQSLEELLRGTDEPPAIRLVNAILLEAINLGASDIHIQPRTKNVMVRLRVDGVLIDKMQIPHNMHQSIVSRIKIMGEMDISERRRPQDGRLAVKTPQKVVDLRISTLPTINGEKIVMRILDRNAAVLRLDGIGFNPMDLAKVRNASDKPQGIVLATGPTGSGKTTTLYSLLQSSATSEKNYITIEDPVEYYLDSAGQVVVREKIGLTFPLVLRAILRQDPDVLLIGEIRDFETAEVAFHAALTGHQVYSTLHTNSAIATISRLFDLGLKPFVIATALEAVIAQRLVRKVCERCRAPAPGDPDLLQRLGGSFAAQPFTAFHGTGCEHCHGSGYKGRLGLYEVLAPDTHMRHLIASEVAITEITQYAREQGFMSLRDDAFIKVRDGLTTPDEVFRVLGPE